MGLFGRKKLLKEAAASRIPKEILERPKSGFTVPVNRWFQGRLAEPFRDIVLGGSAVGSWLRRDAVESLLSRHQRDGRSGLKLWSVLVFAWWLDLQRT